MRPFLLLTLLLASAPALAEDKAPSPSGAPDEEAGSNQKRTGALLDSISPVSGHLFLKEHRHELTPSVKLSLTDPFFQKYLFGGMYTFHVTETLALGIGGALGVSVPSGRVQVCPDNRCRTPTVADLKNTPGNVSRLSSLDLSWSPLYGKISLAAERTLHFDTYAIVGGSFVQFAGLKGAPQSTPGGSWGIGQRYFASEWFTFRLEFRDYIYPAEVVTGGRAIQHQLVFDLGFSFFFPTVFRGPPE